MTFRLAGFGVKKFGQGGGKGIGMFDEGPESIFTTIRIYLALRSLPMCVGGGRILAKRCTAAVFFDYFFEL